MSKNKLGSEWESGVCKLSEINRSMTQGQDSKKGQCDSITGKYENNGK